MWSKLRMMHSFVIIRLIKSKMQVLRWLLMIRYTNAVACKIAIEQVYVI
mgnify:FL=1